MKKYLFLAATAAVTLASCNSEVDFTQETLRQATAEDAQVPVQFGTYIANGNATRALDQSYTNGSIGNADATKRKITDLKKAQFGVFAYSTGAKDYRGNASTPDPFDWTTDAANGKWKKDNTQKYPNFMYNEKIYWSGSDVSTGQWMYDVVKYWPNGIDAANGTGSESNTALQKEEAKVSFFAYAPYMEQASTTVITGGPTGVTAHEVKTKMKYPPSTGVDNGIVAISDNNSPTNVWVKYVMPSANAADAVDLLWGVRGAYQYKETDNTDNPATALSSLDGKIYNENLTKQYVTESSSTAERVKFLFKHALAKIGGATTSDETESTTGDPAQCGFKVVVDIDENSTSAGAGQDNQSTYFTTNFSNAKTLVTLKEVKIQDGKSATDDTDVTTVIGQSSTLNSSGWFNIEEGKWEGGGIEAGSTGATYNVVANNDDDLDNNTYRLNEKILEIGAGKHDATGSVKKLKDADGKEWSTANPVGVTTTATPLFAKENVPGLLLIPGSNNDIYVTVDYFVRTADPKLAAGYSEVEQVITNKVSLASLAPNKYYTIIIHLGLTSVKFEAVVADWATTENGTWDEDGKYTPSGSETEIPKAIWLPSNVVK